MRRLLLNVLAVLAALAIITAAALYGLARRSLPLLNGTVVVSGITAPVDIIRDADAIPHIFAATRLDALYGLGYAHAQDRLWQMDFQRRIGAGRLSEVFGPATIPQDRFLRTVGFRRAAAAAWTTTPDWAKHQVEAYVDGVNAFLATHHGSALPPEFSILGVEPEPWSGVDVLVWVKMMAWDLSSNYTFELLRRDLVRTVGPERMAELLPPYATDGLSIISDPDTATAQGPAHGALAGKRPPRAAETSAASEFSGVGSALAATAAALSQGHAAVADFLLGSQTTEALGSNNWVVDGTLTATGRPLLANDPHLGTRLPSTWYLAHLSAGDFDVIGATLPGAPAIALGRNRFIAWGATNVAADVEDLYREHLDPTGRFAEFRGAQEPLQIVPETIVVKGAAPVHVDVRVSRHGPLVSDAINASNARLPAARRTPPVEPLAFRWTALDPSDTTVASFLLINDARNWDDFTAAMKQFVVPSQNFVYADVDGHIGYFAPGRIPIRAAGDGALPADGWNGGAEWIGWVPFDALPHAFDPPSHFIVTANNRPEPAAYGYMLGVDWTEPYRAHRITDLIRDGGQAGRARVPAAQGRSSGGRPSTLTPDDFAAIQRDTVSPYAQSLLPLLLENVRPSTDRERQAVAMLREWNFDVRGDSAAAAIFEAWSLRLAPAIAGDELGPLVTATYQGRHSFVARFVIGTLARGDSRWCDDVRTPAHETCADTVTAALGEGLEALSGELGDTLTRWRWDAVHRTIFPHQGLDAVALLRPLLSRSMPAAGDWSTIDVGAVDTGRPFEQHSVPGYREIVDLSPVNDSRFIIDLGESGHALSPHYDDFLDDWRAVRHRKMRMERADVELRAIGHLTLTPRKYARR